MTPPELAYIVELEEQIKQQAAVIEQMREAMLEHGKPHLHNEIEWDEALKLRPCPEVLNKVRADAVRKVAEEFGASDRSWLKDYAQRIEKGEA